MTSAKSALIFAIAAVLASSVEAFAAPPQKSPQNIKTGIAVQGKSAFFGPYSMQVGAGLNIRAKFGFTIWDMNKPNIVNMLNAENHLVFRDSAAGWLKWNRRGVQPIQVSEVEPVGKLTVAGQPCIRYFGYQMVGNEKVKVAEFISLQKSQFDPKVLEFWCKHYLLPSKYGFPIAVKQRVGNRLEIILETNTIRPIPMSTISLEVPKNYKETKDKADLYFADAGGGISKSDLESFFQQPLK